jgi:hypothetical protein
MKIDMQVQQDVVGELKCAQSSNASNIGVEVNGGVVTLVGHVDSHGKKWNAESAHQLVSAVKALAVEVDVNLHGSNHRNDVDIVRSVENVLQWSAYLPNDRVRVMADKVLNNISIS